MFLRRGSATALNGSDVVEARGTSSFIHSHMGICQAAGRCCVNALSRLGLPARLIKHGRNLQSRAPLADGGGPVASGHLIRPRRGPRRRARAALACREPVRVHRHPRRTDRRAGADVAGPANRAMGHRGHDGRLAGLRRRESFLLASPDHVSHVAPQWRPLFATTAVLLALTEAAGLGPGDPSCPGKEERVMKVFVAGGSGTIGVPLVRALVAAGHQVTALTRSSSKRDELLALGASVAVADALNREALIAAVEAARPTHVVHQLTALPKGGPRRPSDLEATNRLRIDGTRNLLEAAIHAGARAIRRRLVCDAVGSRTGSAGSHDDAAAAVRSMETPGAGRDPARLDRRRRPSLRAVLRSRDAVDRCDDRDGAEAPAAGRPRRRRTTAADPRGGRGQRDAAGARPGARRRRLRHRGRSRGEHDRDRRDDRGIHRVAGAAQSASAGCRG